MCGRVSVSKLYMDKLCCMYVCMHICMYIYMYLCMYTCMYVSMDAYIYIYIHMSIYDIYMSMYGRSAGTFIYFHEPSGGMGGMKMESYLAIERCDYCFRT